jgi:lambda family phage minor tail protein L
LSLEAHVQKASLGSHVELIDIDLTALGGVVLYLVPAPLVTFASGEVIPEAVTWRGNIYTPHPFETDGWEWGGDGPAPTPKFRTANVDLSFTGLNIQYNDLVGATLTRWRTFDRFLDGKPEADPDSHYQVDVFKIDRKSLQTKTIVEYELASPIDQQGVLLPTDAVLKNSCQWTYRFWDGSEYGYSKVIGCPYVGVDMFDVNGNSTSVPSLDVCGKRVSDCKKRFPTGSLPFGGFPGVARIRQ